MNNSYLERAKKVITDPKILSIVAGKRARQLAWGARPMLKCDSENHLDVALLEIAEGKLYYAYGTGTETDIFANITESPENGNVSEVAAISEEIVLETDWDQDEDAAEDMDEYPDKDMSEDEDYDEDRDED
ncbi:MAG: DNA-directed RNA polymerase subunit omega [Victivallaceae bacterium]|nr:DNA-directed RNA polymerase subunit omega [Victivallaceae bacterium]